MSALAEMQAAAAMMSAALKAGRLDEAARAKEKLNRAAVAGAIDVIRSGHYPTRAFLDQALAVATETEAVELRQEWKNWQLRRIDRISRLTKREAQRWVRKVLVEWQSPDDLWVAYNGSIRLAMAGKVTEEQVRQIAAPAGWDEENGRWRNSGEHDLDLR